MYPIKLGSPPKSFPQTISFLRLTGEKCEIKVQYKYRTRAEFAQFIADLYPTIKTPETQAYGAGVDVEAENKKAQVKEAQYIASAVEGWDLEEEFNAASIARLVDEYPAASIAITSVYREVITEGRSKN